MHFCIGGFRKLFKMSLVTSIISFPILRYHYAEKKRLKYIAKNKSVHWNNLSSYGFIKMFYIPGEKSDLSYIMVDVN